MEEEERLGGAYLAVVAGEGLPAANGGGEYIGELTYSREQGEINEGIRCGQASESDQSSKYTRFSKHKWKSKTKGKYDLLVPKLLAMSRAIFLFNYFQEIQFVCTIFLYIKI